MDTYNGMRLELAMLLNVPVACIRSRLHVWQVRTWSKSLEQDVWIEVDPSIVQRAERIVGCEACEKGVACG